MRFKFTGGTGALLLLASVVATLPTSTASSYDLVDFENLAGAYEGMSIDIQFPGLRFSLLGSADKPRLAKVGDPATAFHLDLGSDTDFPECDQSAPTRFDMPVDAYTKNLVGCWFLTDNGNVSGLPQTVVVEYIGTPPAVSKASGHILDVDGPEKWVVKAYYQGNYVDETPEYSFGDGGDGLATFWSIDVSGHATTPQFDELRFVYTDVTDPYRNVGLAFDNFCADYIGGSLSGIVFDDANPDGAYNPNSPDFETGLPNMTVVLRNSVGAYWTTTTAGDGTYSFNGVEAGSYTMELWWSGADLTQTCPTSVYYSFDLTEGESRVDLDFGLYQCFTEYRCYWEATHGSYDDFTTPEFSYVDADLDAGLDECYDKQIDFDADTENKCFGHTFELPTHPGCVVMDATLCLRLKCYAQGYNDWLKIGHWGPEGPENRDWIWQINMDDLEAYAGGSPPWQDGDVMTVCLDLMQLPLTGVGPSQRVLAALQGGDFDIHIQDDTGVDYIELRVGYCCEGQLCYATGEIDGIAPPLTVSDFNALGSFVQGLGSAPPNPLYEGDLNGDGSIDEYDLDVFEDYLQYGISVFPDYPVPTCCITDTVRGACCSVHYDGQMAWVECHIRSEGNCDVIPYSHYKGHRTFCGSGVCPGYDCMIRGDINHDQAGPDIADLVYLVTYMFQSGPPPPWMGEANVDGNGSGPDIADLVYLVTYMFQGGEAPVPCPE